MRGFIILTGLSLIFMALGCKKSSENGVPYVNVNINIYTNDPIFFNLSVAGGWEYINGGSRGILVYRSSNDQFMAYDRHCTYNPSSSCGRVYVDSSNIIATDTCCGSGFLITDGSVVKSPAVVPLKQYQTSFDGTVLRITN